LKKLFFLIDMSIDISKIEIVEDGASSGSDSDSSFSSCNSSGNDAYYYTISCTDLNADTNEPTTTSNSNKRMIQSDSFRRQKQQILSYEKGNTLLNPISFIKTTPRTARLAAEKSLQRKPNCNHKSCDTKMRYLGAPISAHFNHSTSSMTASFNSSTKSLLSQNSTSVGSNWHESKLEDRDSLEPSWGSTSVPPTAAGSTGVINSALELSMQSDIPLWRPKQTSAPAASSAIILPIKPKPVSNALTSTHSEAFGLSMAPRQITVTKGARKIISKQNRYINQYLIQETLGHGNFGLVKKCKDITTGVTYAMKILRKDNLRQKLTFTWTENNTVEQSSAWDNVEKEIAIMKKLRHPNIVNLLEVINSDKVLYLILEYMAWGSLAKGDVEIDKFVRDESEYKKEDKELLRLYARDMISGLAYLHSQRICHSDIKPENILVGANGVLKLADFGLSKFLLSGESRSVFNQKDGTPAFQAPECLDDKEDLKFSLYPTDVWALGVTLYQVKYGKLPFFSTNEEELAEKVINEPLKIPDEEDKDFADLLHGMLRKDPEKRFTVEDLCVHPWITNRKKCDEIVSSYPRASVTEKEQQKAVAELVKFATLSKSANSDTRTRGLTTWDTEMGPKEANFTDRSSRTYTSNTVRGSSIPLKSLLDEESAGKDSLSSFAKTDSDLKPSLPLMICEEEAEESSLEDIFEEDLDIREITESRTKPKVLPRARTAVEQPRGQLKKVAKMGLGRRFGPRNEKLGLRQDLEMKGNSNQQKFNPSANAAVLKALRVKEKRKGSRIKFEEKATILEPGSLRPQKTNSGKRKSILKGSKK